MANTKERSELQKVCMQYGKDCFAAASTDGLIRLLNSQGQYELAGNVTTALMQARTQAKLNYFSKRKKLQPDWKDWQEQLEENLAKWYEADKIGL
jgi:hypothetical protein